MKKIILTLLIFSMMFVPSVVLAQDPEAAAEAEIVVQEEPVNSFELFWPIAPGRVRGDSLYFLKSFKEKLREVFIFSDYKKAEYNIRLSEKRLVEAEKLINDGNIENAKATLAEAFDRQERAKSFIDKISESTDLLNRYTDSLEKQLMVMKSLYGDNNSLDFVEKFIERAEASLDTLL